MHLFFSFPLLMLWFDAPGITQVAKRLILLVVIRARHVKHHKYVTGLRR